MKPRNVALAFLFSLSLFASNWQQQWQLAEGLYKRSFYDEALVEYQELVKEAKGEERQEVLWRIADCFEGLKQWAQVESQVKKYLQSEQNSDKKDRATYRLGLALLSQKKIVQSEAAFSSLSKSVTMKDLAKYELAGVYLLQKKDQQGRELYRDLAANAQDALVGVYSAFTLANYWRDNNQSSKAIPLYRQAIRKGKKLPDLQQQAYQSLAFSYYRQSEFKASLRIYDEAFYLFPKLAQKTENIQNYVHVALSAAQASKALLFLKKSTLRGDELHYLNTLSLFAAEKYKETLLEAAKITKRSAYDDLISYELKAYFFLKDQAKLKNLIEQYAKSKESRRAYWQASYLTAELQSHKKAALPYYASLFQEDLKTWSLRDDYYLSYAEALEGLKMFEQSVPVWRKIASFKDSKHREFALLKMVEALKVLGKTVEAQLAYEDYLREFSNVENQTYVQFELVKLYLGAKKFKQAESLLLKMIAEEKSAEMKASYQSYLARHYYDRGQYGACTAGFSKIESTYFTIGDQILAAYAHLQLGQQAQALKLWNRAFLKKPKKMDVVADKDYLFIANLLYENEYQYSAKFLYGFLSSRKSAVAIEGYLGLLRYANAESDLKKAGSLIKALDKLALDNDQRAVYLSLRSEEAYGRKAYAEVLEFAEEAERLNFVQQEDNARALYYFALALEQKGNLKQAQRYSNRLFMIFKENTYSAKAMFLSIRLYHLRGELKRARLVAKELRERFLAYYSAEEVLTYLEKHNLDTLD